MHEAYIPLAQLIQLLGEVVGRKKLQKLVYLAQRMGASFREDFAYHLFGPFSEALANEIAEMKMLHLADEVRNTTITGYPQYRYSLTEEGTKLANSKPSIFSEKLVNYVKELNKDDGRTLELKATTWFLLESGIEDAEVPEMIQKLKPEQQYRHHEIDEALRWVKRHFHEVSAQKDCGLPQELVRGY